MNKPELILWGFKSKNGIGAIKLSDNISSRKYYQQDGWTCGVYEKGFDPMEFKLLAQQEILLKQRHPMTNKTPKHSTKAQELVSNCCYAPPLDGIVDDELTGKCSRCKEGCSFETENED